MAKQMTAQDSPFSTMGARWIYLSGPYSIGDQVANARRMCDMWDHLNDTSECLVINPLAGSMVQHFIRPRSHAEWLKYDLKMIRILGASDEMGFVLRLNPEMPSRGADQEISLARSIGVRVGYVSLLDHEAHENMRIFDSEIDALTDSLLRARINRNETLDDTPVFPQFVEGDSEEARIEYARDQAAAIRSPECSLCRFSRVIR